jgi:hypothetical protein
LVNCVFQGGTGDIVSVTGDQGNILIAGCYFHALSQSSVALTVGQFVKLTISETCFIGSSPAIKFVSSGTLGTISFNALCFTAATEAAPSAGIIQQSSRRPSSMARGLVRHEPLAMPCAKKQEACPPSRRPCGLTGRRASPTRPAGRRPPEQCHRLCPHSASSHVLDLPFEHARNLPSRRAPSRQLKRARNRHLKRARSRHGRQARSLRR